MASTGIPELRRLSLEALTELVASLRAEDVERVPLIAELVRIAAHAMVTTPAEELRLLSDPRFRVPGPVPRGPAIARLEEAFRDAPPEAIGHLYEATLDVEMARADGEVLLSLGRGRKTTGSFYTPRKITTRVVRAALDASSKGVRRVCDPAFGGGAFLLETGRQLVERTGNSPGQIAEQCLFGVDSSPLAVAVGEMAIWLWAPDADIRTLRTNLLEGDSVREHDFGDTHFDLVIGNPPWVAYAGRAAQPLPPHVRRGYASRYDCFRGYPTLHGLFVELATSLAPSGVIALVLPSPVADLAGYAPVRRVLAESHTPREPLMEFGQDAFSGVTQPSFALLALPGPDSRGGDREWQLVERQRARVEASSVAIPEAMSRIASGPSFPRELFGEMGFQSAGDVARTLFFRSDEPDDLHTVPLLEGRDVGEFRQGPPRLFLNPDREALTRAKTRLRDVANYQRVRFVTRQTAKFPIAALHSGLPFRNTLLAGFDVEGFSPELVVALLNSSLYRALHIGLRRDARQAAFPQVKIAHLRALPRPPGDADRRARLAELTLRATAGQFDEALRKELDDTVFDLFGLTRPERGEVLELVSILSAGSRRAPAESAVFA